MKIFIVTPALNPPHGGLRVIVEWANRLTKWHDIYLYSMKGEKECNWLTIGEKVNVVTDPSMEGMDCLIITSPHSINFQDHKDCPKKVFIFLQMMEHMFRPRDRQFISLCKKLYTSPHPIISISGWNLEMLKGAGRTGETYRVGNGVNFDDFPRRVTKKDFKTILVEGWEAANPAKDTEHIAPLVAKRLRSEGYKIVAYSQFPLRTMPEEVDEYYFRPNTETLNRLYEEATILLKASKYDARSCAPMEAMTKGTPTARAIIKGDDDLNNFNSVKCGYSEDELYKAAKKALDPDTHEELSKACILYVTEFSWKYWMPVINDILIRG